MPGPAPKSLPTEPIRLIVGLGNPGNRYQATRHNAGFWFLDEIARRHSLQFQMQGKFHGHCCRLQQGAVDCWLLKPETFMNRSGTAVAALANFYRIPADAILVAHDELDFDPGRVRLKFGGGHGGHNGLRDILAHLGKTDFHRLRIGIGHPGERSQVVNYVLDAPNREQRDAIDQSLQRAADCLPELFAGQHQQAMNRLHTD